MQRHTGCQYILRERKKTNQICPRPAQWLALPCDNQQKISASDTEMNELFGWMGLRSGTWRWNFRENLPHASLVEQTPEGTIWLRAFSLDWVKPHKTHSVQPFARGGRWAPSIHGLNRYFPCLTMKLWCFCSASASPSAELTKPML